MDGREDLHRERRRSTLAAIVVVAGLTLACGAVSGRTSAASPAPTAGATVTPGPAQPSPAYIPAACTGKPLSTLSPSQVFAPTPTSAANAPLSSDEQQALAEEILDMVERVYVAPDRLGTEWLAARERLRAQMAEGMDTETYYAAIQDVIRVLGDEHSYLESPAEVQMSDAALAGDQQWVGIGVLAMGLPEAGIVTLLRVYEGSPAERAGLAPHDSLLAVDGRSLVEAGVPEYGRIRGPECSLAILTVASPGQPARKVAVVREAFSLERAIDYRLISGPEGRRIGYIFLPSFFDERIPGEVDRALEEFGRLDGLIIDNRINDGGSSGVLEPVLGLFTSGTVGEFVGRAGSRPLTIEAREVRGSQSVSLVILIGEDTASYGEVFAGVLQNVGRASLVGTATAGNVETLHGYTFGDGSRLWIAQERFVPMGSGADWEGVGVQPDLPVPAAWHTYTRETDPLLAAALAVLGGG